MFLAPSSVLANVAPVIDSLTASTTTVLPGGVVSLQVNGHDPDCPAVCGGSGCGVYIRADLTFWSADGGTFENTDDGVSGSPYTGTTDWRAPAAEGLYTVSVRLSDSGGFMCGGRLSTTQDIQIQVSLNPNQAPVIDSIGADPTRLFPGESSDLTCLASDPDGDALTYAWSADAGSITPGAAGTAVFLADAPGAATVTCSVTDPSGAPASAAVTLSVVGAEAEKWLDRGMTQPRRVSADSTGNLFVLDGSATGIVAVHLLSGTVLYRIPAAGVTSVDVDWNDHLLVGLDHGAQVWDRAGNVLLTLANRPGDVIDVAVDHANRRYGVLDRRSSKVTVYDELGAALLSFGSNGDGAAQCRTPHGLAATPAGGYWTDTHWVVADTGHGMLKVYDGSGTLTASFGGSGGDVGEFIHLADVEVGPDDVIYGSDSFQSWIQAFNPDGTVRETLGEYGHGLGQFVTPVGVTIAAGFDRLVGTSTNSGRLQVWVTTRDPVSQGPLPLPRIDASLSFPEQNVGTSSSALQAQLHNDGGAVFGITAVAIDGDFTQTNDCGDFLDPLQSCTFDVVFTPTAAGTRSGELRVDTTADAEPLRVSLAGTGVQLPEIALAPAALDFGDQTVGTVSAARDVIVTNLGPGPVAIHGISVAGPYLQTHDCPGLLDAGWTCTVAVRFAPQTVGGSFPGFLTVESSALSTPHQVALDGSGVRLRIDLTDVSVSEGDVDPVQALFEVRLDGPSDGNVRVDYATADGTALAGLDYEDSSGTLWFAPGEDRATFTVPVLPDTILEPDEETFSVTLANAVGAVIADSGAVGTILDNEVCAGQNLLRNPGAEEPASGTGIPGWTEVSGFDWHPSAAPPSPWEGAATFHAGQTETALLEQIVDLSAFADLILAGDQVFEFEGYLRSGDEPAPDGARIVVEYLHAVTGQVLASHDSGEIADPSAWQRVHDVRVAPPDTGWVRVRLLATRYTGPTNDAYFDGLLFRSHRAAVLVIHDRTDYEGDAGTSFGMSFEVELSCAYGEQVSLVYATVPGTATEDLDYAYTAGGLEIPSGRTGVTLPVTVYGDAEEEDHETYLLNLGNSLPSDVVLQDGSGLGTITDDDFCPQKVAYWVRHPTIWPVYSLAIGGVQYDQQGILDLLSYRGKDVASDVAKQLAATKLNLAEGSPPTIVPTVVEADEFLTQFPPGSDPSGPEVFQGHELEGALQDYNRLGCR